MRKKIDIIGKHFGKLTVIEEYGRKNGKLTYLCKCDCGGEKIANSKHLREGDIKSCGCLTKGRKKAEYIPATKSKVKRCVRYITRHYWNYEGRLTFE